MSEEIVRNRRRYVAMAARIVASPDTAEDVVQDALVIACGRSGPCPACPDRYACRIVRNLALDHLRREKAQARTLEGLPEGALGPAAPPPAEHRVEAAEDLRRVGRALRGLPDRTREIFIEHRLHGVPQNALARRLSLSPARVNALIRQAHSRCHRCLASADP